MPGEQRARHDFDPPIANAGLPPCKRIVCLPPEACFQGIRSHLRLNSLVI
jgi:hypothetical protein